MPVKSTPRDPVFRTWNFAILTIASILIALFSAELSAQPSRQTTNEATLSNESAGLVATDGRRLNARSGPGTGFTIVGKLEPDTPVQILDTSADGVWLNIQVPDLDESVWVAAEFIAVGAESGNVNSATSTDTTTATSTTTSPEATATPATSATPRVSVQAVTTLLQTRRVSPTPAPTAQGSDEAQGADTETDQSAQESGAAEAAEAAEFSIFDLLPTVTPTPVRADEGDATTGLAGNAADPETINETDEETDEETGSTRPVVRVAALNLQPATSESAETPDTPAETTSEFLAPTPTPAATSTPEPTATPQPTPSVPTAFTQPVQMNVRGGPGTNFDVVRSVPAGTALEILATNPAGDWYQVDVGGEEPGWIFVSLTQTLGPTDAITRLSEEELPQPPAPPEPVVVESAGASAAPDTIAVSAPAPSGGVPFGYGVQAHMLGGGGDQTMSAINDLGFNWVKQQVQWKLFEPSPGGRNFGELQGIVNAAGSRGINVLFSVVDAPEWAREPGFDGSVGGPPQDPSTYAAFVGAMAGQFCGSSLKAIEVWNEQNLHYEWGNKPLNPAEYMNLLRPAYAAIKAACPSMYVISGAPTPAGNNPPFAMDDFQYLEAMYQNGLINYADGIGAHPSGYNVPPSVTWQGGCEAIQTFGNSFNGACDSPHHSWSFRSTMEGYRNIMVTYGDANKKIWPTEFGWAAGGAFDPRYAYANDNSFEEQATWTVEAYQMMRNWGWVGPAILWNLNFRVVADGTEKAQWGIVGNDWQPLPVYHALKAMPK